MMGGSPWKIRADWRKRHRKSLATVVPGDGVASLRVRVRLEPGAGKADLLVSEKKTSEVAKTREKVTGVDDTTNDVKAREIKEWIATCKADRRFDGWMFAGHSTPSGAIVKALIAPDGTRFRSMKTAYNFIANGSVPQSKSAIGGAGGPPAKKKRRVRTAKTVVAVLNVRELLIKRQPDGCMVCGEDNRHSDMLLCDKCELEYHMTCMGLPRRSVPKGDWFCPCCAAAGDVCAVCGLVGDDTRTLLCDNCDKEYHMECLTPPLTAIPEGDWYCPRCERIKEEIVVERAMKLWVRASRKKLKLAFAKNPTETRKKKLANWDDEWSAASLKRKYKRRLTEAQQGQYRKQALRELVRSTNAAAAEREANAPRPIVCARRGAEVVGLRAMVWWPDDNAWYMGRVMKFAAEDRLHLILYEDATDEWIDFETNHHAIGQRLVWAKQKSHNRYQPAQEFVFSGSVCFIYRCISFHANPADNLA